MCCEKRPLTSQDLQQRYPLKRLHSPSLLHLNRMQDMLGDSNPMVVANALAALTEIRDISSTEVVQYTPQLLFKLLRALNECTEWGQVS